MCGSRYSSPPVDSTQKLSSASVDQTSRPVEPTRMGPFYQTAMEANQSLPFLSILNVEKFIGQVRAHSAIWDARTEEYSDKIKRSEAWQEVGRNLYSDFDNVESAKQATIIKELNRKWKNLRQCYKRERDYQMSKPGSAKQKRTQYIYFDILSFLAPVFEMKQNHSNVDDVGDGYEMEEGITEKGETEDYAYSDALETESTTANQGGHSSSGPSKRKRDQENPIADVCHLLTTILDERKAEESRRSETEEDEDRNFLLSLLNYTRPVQGMNKLAMRAELLQVVTKYYGLSVQPHLPAS